MPIRLLVRIKYCAFPGLMNKQFTAKGENAEEIIRTLKEYPDLCREYVITKNARAMFEGVGAYFGSIQKRIQMDKIDPVVRRIWELLNNGELEEAKGSEKEKSVVEKAADDRKEKTETTFRFEFNADHVLKDMAYASNTKKDEIFHEIYYVENIPQETLENRIGQMHIR